MDPLLDEGGSAGLRRPHWEWYPQSSRASPSQTSTTLASDPYSMERAVVVIAAVVEGAAGCRVRGAVDLENRMGRFDLESFGHVRRGGDRFEAVGGFDDGLVVLAVG